MPKSRDKSDLIGKTFANNKFKITEFIGSGSFSEIYKVIELSGTREFAVKLEAKDIKYPQLTHELFIYKILSRDSNHPSIPKTYFIGEFDRYLALVLPLLGPSLAVMFEECHKTFTVKTVTLLGLQMFDIFRYIHSKGIVYRDVKPENFLLGLSQTAETNRLHLIDFGLAVEYMNSSGQHIPYIEGLKLIGTPRYMSINTNMGREQSRRDDMEAIGHLFIYLLKGTLPWSGLKIENSIQLFSKIAEIKRNTKLENLCSDLPKEFCIYLKTVRSLKFTEEPNYNKFIEMFETLLKNMKESKDEVYDWSDTKINTKNSEIKIKSKSVSNLK